MSRFRHGCRSVMPLWVFGESSRRVWDHYRTATWAELRSVWQGDDADAEDDDASGTGSKVCTPPPNWPVIGRGATGTVRACVRLADGAVCAIKTIRKVAFISAASRARLRAAVTLALACRARGVIDTWEVRRAVHRVCTCACVCVCVGVIVVVVGGRRGTVLTGVRACAYTV